jgi:hypothetical protein
MRNQILLFLGKTQGALALIDIMNPMLVLLSTINRMSMSGDAMTLIKEEHVNVSVFYNEENSTQNIYCRP